MATHSSACAVRPCTYRHRSRSIPRTSYDSNESIRLRRTKQVRNRSPKPPPLGAARQYALPVDTPTAFHRYPLRRVQPGRTDGIVRGEPLDRLLRARFCARFNRTARAASGSFRAPYFGTVTDCSPSMYPIYCEPCAATMSFDPVFCPLSAGRCVAPSDLRAARARTFS